MANSIAILKFPDDTIMYGLYQDTSDVLFPFISSSKDDLESIQESSLSTLKDEEVFDAEVFVDYAEGMYWDIKASKTKIYENFHPFKESVSYGYSGLGDDGYMCSYGVPEWANKLKF